MSIKVVLLMAVVATSAMADRNPYRPPSRPSYQPPSAPSYQPPSAPSYQPPSPPRYNAPRSEESYEPPKYEFDWAVNEDYTKFNHEEQRDYDNTKGSYSVDLPDGRRQTVTYYVDGDSGFVAEVTYSGEAQYPESREYSAPAPSYNTPRPSYQTPRPTTSRPVYTTSRPVYTTARPVYTTPRPSNSRSDLLKAYGF